MGLFKKKTKIRINDDQFLDQVEDFCRKHGITVFFDFMCRVRELDPKLYAWCMHPTRYGERMQACRKRVESLRHR